MFAYTDNIKRCDEIYDIQERLRKCFSQRGFSLLPSVPITAHNDRTVFLANSATNLFKPCFDTENCAVYAMQKSMRTQQLSDYYDPSKEIDYPTCFVSYGAYSSQSMLDLLISTSLMAMNDIGFDSARMRVRVCSGDLEKWQELLRYNFGEISVDHRADKYAHQYGGQLTGRSAKVDYYQPSLGRFKNLLYFISIFEAGKPRGMEMATSDQQLLLRKHEARYGIAMSIIADMLPVNSFSQRRFADSVVGASNLIVEGIKPNASTTNGRTLKKYFSALRYFADDIGYTVDQIADIICKYIAIDGVERKEVDRAWLARSLRDERCLRYRPDHNGHA